MSAKNHDFSRNTNLLQSHFQRVAPDPQRVAPMNFPQHFDGRNTSGTTFVLQSVALKFHSTQWLGLARNTATLLLHIVFKHTHMHTHTHVHRASSRSVFEVLRGPRGGCRSGRRRLLFSPVVMGALGGEFLPSLRANVGAVS